ncbi:MAG TPA: hypothetical protein VLT86_08065, partial [Vicinamibacterales bacterium]|nr:hypothetical protein [Vicinamibacterales bacterium]
PADRRHRDPWFQRERAALWSHAVDVPDASVAPARATDAAALTLSLPVASPDATVLTLVVDEGDNSALPISTVQLVLPSYRLRFVRPGGAIRLVYGSAIAAPQYDLALLAPAVLGAAVADVSMAAEVPTPAAAATEPFISPRTFWVVLIAAVVALLGVLAALLRRT